MATKGVKAGTERGPYSSRAKLLDQALHDYLHKNPGTRDALVSMAIKMALSGDVNALKFLWERESGKVPNEVSVNNNTNSDPFTGYKIQVVKTDEKTEQTKVTDDSTS